MAADNTRPAAAAISPLDWQQALSVCQAAILAEPAMTTALDWIGITSAAGIDRQRRLQIYHHAYRARLQETLADTYSRVYAWLGEVDFNIMALAYLAACPPQAPTLRDYGASLPTWLQQQTTGFTWHEPEVVELAQLDWALRDVFDAPDTAILAPGILADPTIDWTKTGWQLAPRLRICRFEYNTLSLWRALEAHLEAPHDEALVTASAPIPPLPTPTTERLPAPQTVVIWRQGWQPHFRSLDPQESALLTLLAATPCLSFAEVCQQWQQTTPDADPALLGQYLLAWMESGVLVGLQAAC
ncbi:DNA-binding domain-containing protein [Parvibium lacunae]|uniref:DUF2063 domain-containing protein n=1 Tax=Parvibium lacunae TaxID=1888893 RepID=A0A368KYT4_9BURK|nr:DNA-binding domain-containing protein [Parvibium lacunae]RCS56578.1 DUF2063 domain-containing protein [Parvibium lacunae]